MECMAPFIVGTQHTVLWDPYYSPTRPHCYCILMMGKLKKVKVTQSK